MRHVASEEEGEGGPAPPFYARNILLEIRYRKFNFKGVHPLTNYRKN